MRCSPRSWLTLPSLLAVLLFVSCSAGGPTAPSVVLAHTPSGSALGSTADEQMAGVIEALFLGTGPLAMHENPGCDHTLHRLRGWPRGSRVRVVAYASVDEARRTALQRTLSQAASALGHVVSTEYQTRDDIPEPAGSPEGEISVFGAVSTRVPALCGINAENCQVVRYNAGAYVTSRVVLGMPFTEGSSAVVAHELGHAFGLCHIAPERGGLSGALSVMGSSRVTEWTMSDLEAIRRVYAAGLSPGDARQKFVAAGLLD